MEKIAFSKRVAVGDEKLILPDIPPTSVKGEAIEKDLMLYAEIKGTLPYMWEERTQDRSVVYLYGVPVMAMDIEDGKIEKVYKKQEQVEKIAKEIRSGQSERRLLAGTVYGVAKDINTGEAYFFRRNVGHSDVVRNTLAGYLGLIFNKDYQEVRKKVLKGEANAYEQFVAIQGFIRNNANKVASELYKGLIVSDKNENEFLKNPSDIPKSDKVYIFQLKVGEEQRVLFTNTREYNALMGAYAQKMGWEKENKISLRQFPYISEIREHSEFVPKLNNFFSARKRFEKEGDQGLPVDEKTEKFFSMINEISEYLYTGREWKEEERLDEKTQEEIVQGITIQEGEKIVGIMQEEDDLDKLEALIEKHFERQEVSFFQGR
ncbi:MAG: hypothetical protein QW733_01880 [Desulfurococcaceae archaeon]